MGSRKKLCIWQADAVVTEGAQGDCVSRKVYRTSVLKMSIAHTRDSPELQRHVGGCARERKGVGLGRQEDREDRPVEPNHHNLRLVAPWGPLKCPLRPALDFFEFALNACPFEDADHACSGERVQSARIRRKFALLGARLDVLFEQKMILHKFVLSYRGPHDIA